MPDKCWLYQLAVAEVKQALASDKTGLTSTEAKLRLTKYGYNELKFKRRGPLTRFLLQFHSPLVYILLVTALMTAFLNMWIHASVILAVVLANTAIGFIQTGRTLRLKDIFSETEDGYTLHTPSLSR